MQTATVSFHDRSPGAPVARADAKKKPRVPSRGARRAGSVHSPEQVEKYLTRALVALARKWNATARAVVLAEVPRFAKPPKDHRSDAREPSTKAVEQKLRSAASRTLSQQAVRSVCESAARRVESHSKDKFRRLGIKVEKEPSLKHLVDGWARDQAERVKGATELQIAQLSKILATAGNREASFVAKDVEEQLGVSESRAEFIARDSIQTLNAKISRERMGAASIDLYVWTTVGDDRVRPEHEALDGEVFDVDGPGDPDEGHAGDPPGCRCVAYPLPSDKPDDEDE